MILRDFWEEANGKGSRALFCSILDARLANCLGKIVASYCLPPRFIEKTIDKNYTEGGVISECVTRAHYYCIKRDHGNLILRKYDILSEIICWNFPISSLAHCSVVGGEEENEPVTVLSDSQWAIVEGDRGIGPFRSIDSVLGRAFFGSIANARQFMGKLAVLITRTGSVLIDGKWFAMASPINFLKSKSRLILCARTETWIYDETLKEMRALRQDENLSEGNVFIVGYTATPDFHYMGRIKYDTLHRRHRMTFEDRSHMYFAEDALVKVSAGNTIFVRNNSATVYIQHIE